MIGIVKFSSLVLLLLGLYTFNSYASTDIDNFRVLPGSSVKPGISVLETNPVWTNEIQNRECLVFEGQNSDGKFSYARESLSRYKWLLTILALSILIAFGHAWKTINRKQILELEQIRFNAELSAAKKLQQSQIPYGSHELGAFQVTCEYMPASEVGGDYFDYRLLKDGRLALAIADVAGHGLLAGMLVSMAKSALIISHIDDEVDVDYVLKTVNETIFRGASKGMFLTFCYLIIDPVKRKLICSINGHPFPIINKTDGSCKYLDVDADLPLGIRQRHTFPRITVDFNPGDTLLLYTDGLPEQPNPDGDAWDYKSLMNEFSRLSKTQPLDSIAAGILERAIIHAGGAEQMDDMTAVTIRYKE